MRRGACAADVLETGEVEEGGGTAGERSRLEALVERRRAFGVEATAERDVPTAGAHLGDLDIQLHATSSAALGRVRWNRLASSPFRATHQSTREVAAGSGRRLGSVRRGRGGP
jgi:hypothetical protein